VRRVVATVLAVLGLLLGSGAVAAPARADTTICEKDGATAIQNGKYYVQNDNRSDDATQCVDVTGLGFSVTEASHDRPVDGAPGSYPSIFAGCHHGRCTSGSGLPMRIDDSRFDGIQTSVQMTYPSGGVYNASYRLWFDPGPRTDGQNTGAEIAIWLNRVGAIQPIGSRVGTVSLGGTSWEVWYGDVGWNVISYVRSSATASIGFAVGTFVNDAIGRGHVQRTWYLTSVQAGFEPWVGQTGLAVNNFTYGIVAPGRCSATGTLSYGGGNVYTVDLRVTNTGPSTIHDWTVTTALPAGHTLAGSWGATVTTWGQTVTARNLSYNGSLAPGASAYFGLQAIRPPGVPQWPSAYACTTRS